MFSCNVDDSMSSRSNRHGWYRKREKDNLNVNNPRVRHQGWNRHSWKGKKSNYWSRKNSRPTYREAENKLKGLPHLTRNHGFKQVVITGIKYPGSIPPPKLGGFLKHHLCIVLFKVLHILIRPSSNQIIQCRYLQKRRPYPFISHRKKCRPITLPPILVTFKSMGLANLVLRRVANNCAGGLRGTIYRGDRHLTYFH